jgi:hypothetical protein
LGTKSETFAQPSRKFIFLKNSSKNNFFNMLFKRPFKKVRSRETSKSWVFAVTNNKAKNRAIAWFFYAYTCFLFLSFAGTVCKTALSLSTYPNYAKKQNTPFLAPIEAKILLCRVRHKRLQRIAGIWHFCCYFYKEFACMAVYKSKSSFLLKRKTTK